MENNNIPTEPNSENQNGIKSTSPVSNPKPAVKRLKGGYIIIIIFLIIAGATFPRAIKLAAKLSFGPSIELWDMSDVGNELLDYVKNNNHQFPPADKWCDVMLESKDNSMFGDYKDHKDNFPYTLNKHVYECNNIPDNMVVLFSGVPGWNKTGDHKLIWNNDVIRVFFGNGKIKTFKKNIIQYLRWEFKDSGIIPKPDSKIPLMFISSILALVFIALLIYYRTYLKTYWRLALITAILAVIIGVILGDIAENMYYIVDGPNHSIALWAGSIWGFLIGLLYIAVIGKIHEKYNPNVSMVGYATVIGAIMGVAASYIVHGYMMIAYEEHNFDYMLTCACFGIIAGLLLGWISSDFIKLYKNNPAISNKS